MEWWDNLYLVRITYLLLDVHQLTSLLLERGFCYSGKWKASNMSCESSTQVFHTL
jgi:hypothetical protein